jgi:hypothetical protein
MLRIILLMAAFSVTSFVKAQKRQSIEVDFHVRYDKHADFTTRFFARTFTNQIRLWGVSNGANVNFLQPLSKRVKLKIGIGYHKLVMDKVRQTNRGNLVSPSRIIEYVHSTGVKPVFSTDYYHYNNLAFTGGLSYEAPLNKLGNINAGAEINYLHTFSQLYNIDYDNSTYRTRNSKGLGFGVNTYIGIIKRFRNDKYYFNPKIIVPVYQQLRGDQVFGEDTNLKMNKWFNGGGVSFTIGKYL